MRRRRALLDRGIVQGGMLLVVAAALFAGVRVFLPGTFATITAPLLSLGTSASAGVAGVAAATEDAQALANERNQLARDNAALTTENQKLAAQVHDLTQLLGTRTAPQKGIVAAVLARPPQSPYDTLLLDSGTRAGVSVGDRVVAPGGVTIGRISAVTAGAARTALYSYPQATTTAWVGSGRIPVELLGQGAGAYSASAPREAGVVEGDSVYVAGDGAEPIGTVVKVETSAAASIATIFIRPAINIFSLTWVTIVPASLP